jgi:hypothetical protein
VDIDKLDDKEKVILMQYLQEQYRKDPESLPMSREAIEQFFEENQHLLD